MSLFDQWMSESTDNKREYAEEGFILEVSERLWEVMNRKGVTQAHLAEKLGVSAPRISKLMNGNANMTLRTLANIMLQLDVTPTLLLSDNQGISCQQARASVQNAFVGPFVMSDRAGRVRLSSGQGTSKTRMNSRCEQSRAAWAGAEEGNIVIGGRQIAANN